MNTFLVTLLASLLSFTQVDAAIEQKADYVSSYTALKEMLPQASSPEDRAGVRWRLSLVCLMRGEQEKDKEARRKWFNEGIQHAEQAIQAAPKDARGYMWHCANVGRECQTHSFMEQASAVPVMTKDLTTILDKLGQTDYYAAWQALSEIYCQHPMKSTDAGINYARKAACCVPAGEVRLETFVYFAKLLYERNWKKDKRQSVVAADRTKFATGYASAVDKYAWFDGTDSPMPWSKADIGTLSDREEALLVLEYARKRYDSGNPGARDRRQYCALTDLMAKWK